MPPAPPRLRLWIKLLLWMLLPTGGLLLAIGVVAHELARDAMEEQLGASLAGIAQAAAAQVSGLLVLSLQPGDEGTRTHRNLVRRLSELQRASGVERILLFDPAGRALVDSESAFVVGEPIAKLKADRLEIEQVFKGQTASSLLFESRDGRVFKTGFAPVVTDGTVRAAVAVDGSAAFFGPLGRLSRALLSVGVLALFAIALLTLLVARGITRPLHRLAQAATAIGRGELSVDIRIETRDEIGLLATTLNEMRGSIQARDRELQLMLSGIAHEVRNPLGGMALYVGLLREELHDQPTPRGYAERIERELGYLERVVNDFLDFARVRPLEAASVNPREEIEAVLALCAPEAERRGIELAVRVEDSLAEVTWDAERIRRALLNLLQNAIQASGQGGRVEVALASVRDGLRLSVCDRGTGIPDDLRERIFEPFFTTRQQGTGLGLALVKRIVQSHGGRIAVRSKVGEGTVFEIELPQTEVHAWQTS